MANQGIYELEDTWNDGGTTWHGIRLTVTNSASASDSKLIELRIGTAPKFSVDKAGDLTITSDDAGAAAGPNLTLYRDSASPAASDVMGRIRFRGEDSDGNIESYSEIYSRLDDPTSGSEDASVLIRTAVAGTMTTMATFAPGGITLNSVVISNSNSITGVNNLTASGTVTAAQNFVSSTTTAVVAPTGAGDVRLRPNGSGSTTGQAVLDSSGNLSLSGALTAGSITSGFGSIDIGSSTLTAGAGTLASLTIGTYSETGAGNGKQVTGNSYDSSRNSTGTTSHLRFFNPNNQVGSITTNGSATAYNTSSDERLKDKTGHLAGEDALAIILADPVWTFDWKKSGESAVGWGAQTSYGISRDLASPGEGEPGNEDFMPWGVDQAKRTPYLWAATAHLAGRLADLEARVDAL
ncbi:MAG: hypothetical protein K5872_22290 [Rhizobiaceae bacterium]|nr:hypothetical protein [Rhizobiaceae bacterium]MCV0408951.1 hypothetical protein [Rhizobiaceae bacterium]